MDRGVCFLYLVRREAWGNSQDLWLIFVSNPQKNLFSWFVLQLRGTWILLEAFILSSIAISLVLAFGNSCFCLLFLVVVAVLLLLWGYLWTLGRMEGLAQLLQWFIRVKGGSKQLRFSTFEGCWIVKAPFSQASIAFLLDLKKGYILLSHHYLSHHSNSHFM